ADVHPGRGRRARDAAARDPADQGLPGRAHPRGQGLRRLQRGDVQRRRRRHGEEPALEPGPEERGGGRSVGAVAVPAREAITHIHATAFVAPGAIVLGDVTLGPRSSVWYGAVLRGDMDRIVVGEASNIQDGTIVHVDAGLPAL